MNTLSYKTISANKETVKKEWVVIDATDQVVGRLCSKVAKLLRGKYKPNFTPHVTMLSSSMPRKWYLPERKKLTRYIHAILVIPADSALTLLHSFVQGKTAQTEFSVTQ